MKVAESPGGLGQFLTGDNDSEGLAAVYDADELCVLSA